MTEYLPSENHATSNGDDAVTDLTNTKTKKPWSTKKKALAGLAAAVLVAGGGSTGGVSISNHVAFTHAQDDYAAVQQDAAAADKKNATALDAITDFQKSAPELNKGAAVIVKDGSGYFGADELKALKADQKTLAESLKQEVPELVKTHDASAKKTLTSIDELNAATQALSKTITPVKKQTTQFTKIKTSILDAADAVTTDLQNVTKTADKGSKTVLKDNAKASKKAKDAFKKAAQQATDAVKATEQKLLDPMNAYIDAGKKLIRSHKKVVADEKAKAEAAAQAAAEAEAAAAAQSYSEPDYGYDEGYSEESYSEPSALSNGGGGSSGSGGGGGFINYGSGGGGP
ncbi:MAG: hypothetical protein ACTHW9_06375, partial [Canibacter sp.]